MNGNLLAGHEKSQTKKVISPRRRKKRTRKPKSHACQLVWLDEKTGMKFNAGVAFYEEKYGEYRLKIDEEAPRLRYYAKIIGVEENVIKYRVEIVVKSGDGRWKRKTVGYGQSSPSTDGNVHLNYGSKAKTLVIVLNGEDTK